MTTTTGLPRRGEDNFVCDRRRLLWLPATTHPPGNTYHPPTCATHNATLTPALLKWWWQQNFGKKAKAQGETIANCCCLQPSQPPLSFQHPIPPLFLHLPHAHFVPVRQRVTNVPLFFFSYWPPLCWYIPFLQISLWASKEITRGIIELFFFKYVDKYEKSNKLSYSSVNWIIVIYQTP